MKFGELRLPSFIKGYIELQTLNTSTTRGLNIRSNETIWSGDRAS